MLTEKDIKEQINRDAQVFWDKPYDGFIPEGLIQKFRRGLMVTPFPNWGMSDVVAARIAAKKDEDLAMVDVGLIINMIFSVPFEYLFETLEEGLEYNAKLQKIKTEFNGKVEAVNKSLQRKQKKLMEIAGLTNAAVIEMRKN